jgi:hypothetical protein
MVSGSHPARTWPEGAPSSAPLRNARCDVAGRPVRIPGLSASRKPAYPSSTLPVARGGGHAARWRSGRSRRARAIWRAPRGNPPGVRATTRADGDVRGRKRARVLRTRAARRARAACVSPRRANPEERGSRMKPETPSSKPKKTGASGSSRSVRPNRSRVTVERSCPRASRPVKWATRAARDSIATSTRSPTSSSSAVRAPQKSCRPAPKWVVAQQPDSFKPMRPLRATAPFFGGAIGGFAFPL